MHSQAQVARRRKSSSRRKLTSRYFNDDEILEKVLLSCVPRFCTTVMIATEIPAAISPYSIAVAPLVSRRKFRNEPAHDRPHSRAALKDQITHY